MKWIKMFMLWIWQIPQNYIAFFICGVLGPLCTYGGIYNNKSLIISNNILSNFSLGDYIFIKPNTPEKGIRHELGHSYQSQLLGWFYIPVIAIPSITHNIVHSIISKFGKAWNYYSFYTEKWADKLSESEKIAKIASHYFNSLQEIQKFI